MKIGQAVFGGKELYYSWLSSPEDYGFTGHNFLPKDILLHKQKVLSQKISFY
jgi:hypothetical protein